MSYQMINEKVIDMTIHGSRIVAVHRYVPGLIVAVHRYAPGLDEYPLLDSWYCAYLQVKSDFASKSEDELDDLFPQALGGITYQGRLPNTLADDGKTYIGFDTAHFGMERVTLEQVLGALKEMEKKYRGIEG